MDKEQAGGGPANTRDSSLHGSFQAWRPRSRLWASSGACPGGFSPHARLKLCCRQQALSKAADSLKWKCSAKKCRV